MIRKDKLTEWQYGEGAIKLAGKFLMLRREKISIILGGVLEDLHSSEPEGLLNGVEMWESEIILIPRRKFILNKTESCFAGLSPDQMLGSEWGNPKNWDKIIFDKTVGDVSKK